MHIPLFLLENGSAIHRRNFLTTFREIRTNHADSHITGHSMRVGVATSAAKARIEDHLIKSLGRWTSDSYVRYIKTPDSAIKHAQQSMLHVS